MTLYTNFRWGFTGEPQTMLVADDRVVWRREGSVEMDAQERIDCRGAYLLPKFIDAHCHILPTGLDLQKLHLGSAQTKEEVLDLVAQRHRELDEREWLLAVHYDQTKFSDGKHLTRHDLDAISRDRKILLRHVNGHASVANSAALQAAGIDEQTPDPLGGAFERDETGSLTGVLLESAHERVTSASDKVSLEQMVQAILAAGEKMAELGIGCATDMMTGRYDLDLELQAYRMAAEAGCRVRTRLYLQWSTVFGKRALAPERLAEHAAAMDPERCRIAGIKIFADGAIGSATAAIYGSYEGGSYQGGSYEGQPPAETSGQLIYSPERLKTMVRTAHDAGFPIAIHSIGDYATDLVMDAYEPLGDARRHRIEHAMILSDTQIERMAKLGIHCTMQPEFLHWFGHAYRRQLGEERAARLKRVRSVIDAGVPISFNSDRPIVSGDPWDGILTAQFRPGFDQAEAATREEGLWAYTRGGAAANHDEGLMGALEPGQVADLNLFQQDPLQIMNPVRALQLHERECR